VAAGVVVCLSMVPAAEAARDGSNCSVSVDDILGGETAALAIQNAFPAGATGVEIGGQAGHVAANNRHTGFTKGIEGKNIEVLDYQNPSAWDAKEAQDIAADMITKYGDKIQYIFCHWDNGATGVINALKATGQDWANKVMIVAVDGNKTGFSRSRAGRTTSRSPRTPRRSPRRSWSSPCSSSRRTPRRSRTTSSRSTSSPRRRSTTSKSPSGKGLSRTETSRPARA
jgi:ABC-type sugar transport system substrate-binding protein